MRCDEKEQGGTGDRQPRLCSCSCSAPRVPSQEETRGGLSCPFTDVDGGVPEAWGPPCWLNPPQVPGLSLVCRDGASVCCAEDISKWDLHVGFLLKDGLRGVGMSLSFSPSEPRFARLKCWLVVLEIPDYSPKGCGSGWALRKRRMCGGGACSGETRTVRGLGWREQWGPEGP